MIESTFGDFNLVCNKISENLLNTLCTPPFTSYDIILSPIGLCHPFHIATRKGIELAVETMGISYNPDHVKVPEIIYYVDKPYYQHRYVKEMYASFKEQIHYSKYKEVTSPEVNKEFEILEVFKTVYPTELGIMRFSKDILTKDQDIFLIPNNVISDYFKEILS